MNNMNISDPKVRECIKKTIGLKYGIEPAIAGMIYKLLKYVEEKNIESQVTMKLSELYQAVKPRNLILFDKMLYLLSRYGFIIVEAPYELVRKPRSVLKGQSWKGVRQIISERGKDKRSAGEILLHIIYTTRSKTKRWRRRKILKDILEVTIIPSKLNRVKQCFQLNT